MMENEEPSFIETLDDPRLPTGTRSDETAVFIGAYNSAVGIGYASEQHARRVAADAVKDWQTRSPTP